MNKHLTSKLKIVEEAIAMIKNGILYFYNQLHQLKLRFSTNYLKEMTSPI